MRSMLKLLSDPGDDQARGNIDSDSELLSIAMQEPD